MDDQSDYWITNSNKRIKIIKQNTIINNYEIQEKIGEGSFSDVFKVINNNKIKIMKVYKQSNIYYKCGIFEKDILIKLKSSTFFCKIYDYFTINNHLFLILDYYHMDLYEYYSDYTSIKFNFKDIINNLLNGLAFLEENKLVHSDLKPENILIKLDGEKIKKIVICDFSSTLSIDKIKKNLDVVSLWYRPPEIYLNGLYDYKLDVWSLGCILYELITLKPLFKAKCNKNNNNIQNMNLLKVHSIILGNPSEEIINKFNDSITIISENIIINENINKYLRYYLAWNPKDRLSAKELLLIELPIFI